MKTTIFSLLCQVCGLSHREAVDFLSVRPDTVKSWSAGRNQTPPTVLAELAELAERIDAAADEVVAVIANVPKRAAVADGKIDTIEIGLAADDHEAQGLGWPCVGAHRAAIALTISRGMAEGFTFAVVPRGSTPATAAAADEHDKIL